MCTLSWHTPCLGQIMLAGVSLPSQTFTRKTGRSGDISIAVAVPVREGLAREISWLALILQGGHGRPSLSYVWFGPQHSPYVWVHICHRRSSHLCPPPSPPQCDSARWWLVERPGCPSYSVPNRSQQALSMTAQSPHIPEGDMQP